MRRYPVTLMVFFVWKLCSKFFKLKPKIISFTNEIDVTMYASLAYGTQYVLGEPGIEHLYESIDE